LKVIGRAADDFGGRTFVVREIGEEAKPGDKRVPLLERIGI
jgi:hypothetical protein